MFQKLNARWKAGRRVCVGLDSRKTKLPKRFGTESDEDAILRFNLDIIEATAGQALAYKLNLGAYLASGQEGIGALEDTCDYLSHRYPEVPFVIDQKTTDIGDSNMWYAEFAFDRCKADAITAGSYPGGDAAQALLQWPGTTVFFLCKTSNKGSGDFQDLPLLAADPPNRSMPLYEFVAETIEYRWDRQPISAHCGLVVGATYPEQMKEIRKRAPSLQILCPGIGKQQGDLEMTLRNGLMKDGGGLVINEGSSIVFASGGDDFASVAAAKLAARTTQIDDVMSTL